MMKLALFCSPDIIPASCQFTVISICAMREKLICYFIWGQICQTERLAGRKEGEREREKKSRKLQAAEFQTNHINAHTQPSLLSVTECRRSLLCGAAFLCMVKDVVNL